jgi:TPR repeat protein
MRVGVIGVLGLFGCGNAAPVAPVSACDATHIDVCHTECMAGSTASCDQYATIAWPADSSEVANPPELTEVLEKSCSLGDGQGCQILGSALKQGAFGMPKDEERAIELWVVSCNAKWATGCRLLAFAYQNGWSVQANQKVAIRHFQDGCDLGEQSSCNELSWMVISSDPEKAIGYWQKGCDGKNGESCRGLAWAAKNGAGMPEDDAKARQIAEAGCGYTDGNWACGLYGWYLMEGIGGDRDTVKGKEMMTQACTAGFQWSCDTLKGYDVAASPFITTP